MGLSLCPVLCVGTRSPGPPLPPGPSPVPTDQLGPSGDPNVKSPSVEIVEPVSFSWLVCWNSPSILLVVYLYNLK